MKVALPEMGESVAEGSIVEWRVKPGQWVEQGATLVDVTTDKVDVEVPAPVSGVVKAARGEGETVAVGAALAEIDPSASERPAARGDGGPRSRRRGRRPSPGAAKPAPATERQRAAPPRTSPAPGRARQSTWRRSTAAGPAG